MRKHYLALCALLTAYCGQAQLTGTKTIPGDYADLAAAVTDLNAAGVGTGGVTFQVNAAQSLSAPLVISVSGTATNPIVFQGNASVLTATGSTATNDAIIVLAGADFVTLNNFVLNGNNTVEWGIAFLKRNSAVPFDGAQNNVVSNNTITLDRTNTSSLGIYGAHHTAASTSLLATTGTTADDANSNNQITGNTVTNAYIPIQLTGIGTAAVYDSGNSISGNTISGFGGGSVATYGVRTVNYAGVTITNNNVTLPGGTTATSYGIFASTGNGAVAINGNNVTLTGGATTSTLFGIVSAASGTSLQLNGNTVSGSSYATATSGAFTGLQNTGTPTTVQMNNNTVTGNSLAGTGTMTLMDGGSSTSITSITMTGNTVTNNTKTGASGSLFCIRAGTSVVNISNNLVSDNGIPNTSGTSAATLAGIYNISSPTGETYNNNIVRNLLIGGTTTSTSSALYGMYSNTIAAGNKVTSGNTIHGLSMVTGGTSYGIFQAAGTALISQNKIFDIQGGTTSGLVYGVHISSGVTITVANNFIGDLRAPAANANLAVAGINVSGSTSTNAYYNTVYLSATSTGTNFGTAALNASTSPNLALNNNIFYNLSTANGTGLTAAYRRTTTTIGTYAGSSNNNIFFAGTPSATNVIFTDVTNADQTLAAFQQRVAPREGASKTGILPFLSTAGSSTNFLRLDPAVANTAESGGAPVAGINLDFDGDTRNASNPDIGADEFDGLALSNCFNPGTPQASALLPNSASLGWTAGNGAANFEWELRTTGTCGSGSPVQNGTVAGLSVNLTALTANTTYSFCVRRDCGGGTFSDWVTVTFTTPCSPISALPWTEGFEGLSSVGAGVVPSCWNTQMTTGVNFTSASTAVRNSIGARSGTRYVWARYSSDAWLFSPAFELTAGVSYDFSYFFANTDNLTGFTLVTAVGNAQNGAAMTTTLGTITNPVHTTHQRVRYTFVPATSGVYHFGIRSTGNGTPWYLVFDDFRLETSPSLDVATAGLVAPAVTCPTANAPLAARIVNASGVALNLAANPVTVTASVSGAGSGTLSGTANSGTLAPGDTLAVNLQPAFSFSTGGSYIFNVAATLAGDGFTGNDSSVSTVFVNSNPTNPFVEEAQTVACAGTPRMLVARGGRVPGTGTIGTGTLSTTTSTPYRSGWGGTKNQYIYTAAELTALGLRGGDTLRSIGWRVMSQTNTPTLNGFTIALKHTTAATASTTLQTGTTTVFGPVNYTLSGSGSYVNSHTLTGVFVWDGSSNLLVETCFNNNDAGTTSVGVAYTTTSGSMTVYSSADNAATHCASASTGTTTTTRPNLVLGFDRRGTYTWAPATGLFTNAAATTAYAANASADTVYALINTPTSYQLIATSPAGCTVQDTVELTLGNPTVQTTFLSNQTVCAGQPVTLTVNATGTGIRYQWRRNGNDIFNATSNSYTIPAANVSDSGRYFVFITGACGTLTDSALVTVNPQTLITQEPGAPAGTGCNMTPVTLSVVASGTSLTYQWYRDGAAINGANSSTYTITAAGTATYQVIVAGTCGLDTSAAVAVSLNPMPQASFTAPAQVCAGTAVTFTNTSAVATGSISGYQWQFGNGQSSTNANPTVTFASPGIYTVMLRAISAAGCADSVMQTIQVLAPVAINSQPASQTICPGSTLTLTVGATGSGLSYQWRKGTNDIANATGATLTINNAGSGDAGSYTVLITGPCGSATSQAAVIVVAAANSWTGAVSTNWNDSANWCGGVPTSSSNVIIPNVPNYPVISGSVSVGQLTVATGARVEVTTGANLNLFGNLINNGTISATNGTLTVSGTTAVMLDSVTVGNLVINNPAGVTLNGRANVIGTVTLTQGHLVLGNHQLNVYGSISAATGSHIVTNGTGTVVITTPATTPVTIPVGPDAARYAPVTIANGDSRRFSVSVANGINPTIAWAANAINLTWNITPETSSANPATITLGYADAQGNTAFNAAANLEAGVYNGNSWTIQTPAGGVAPAGTASSRSITFSTSTFGPMVVGNLGSILLVTSAPRIDADVTSAQLLPNVVLQDALLRVVVRRSMQTQWSIADAQGRILKVLNFTLTPGTNDLRLSLGDLPSGSYFLKGSSSKGSLVTLRFVRL